MEDEKKEVERVSFVGYNGYDFAPVAGKGWIADCTGRGGNLVSVHRDLVTGRNIFLVLDKTSKFIITLSEEEVSYYSEEE